MSEPLQSLETRLREHFADKMLTLKSSSGQLTLELLPAQLLEVCQRLRDDHDFAFAQLSDLCGIDYAAYGQADWETQNTTRTGFSRGVSKGIYDEHKATHSRFAVIYHLLSIKHNERLRLRCFIDNEPPRVSSVTQLWAGADWYEREAFDLFGIMFEGHPDLRRILTDYGFIGHPFRKDFPLEGNVEVRYDPDKQRVVYQPVTIKNRILVPKVIRHDNRYMSQTAEQETEHE